jgi:hypothetical protein
MALCRLNRIMATTLVAETGSGARLESSTLSFTLSVKVTYPLAICDSNKGSINNCFIFSQQPGEQLTALWANNYLGRRRFIF